MRKDYTTERSTIISENKSIDPKKLPYAPGNESMTKPSILSLVLKNGMLQRQQDNDFECVKNWSIRVFESENPIATINAPNVYNDRPHYIEPTYGYHYIVVASPNKDDTLSSIDTDQWSNVLSVVQDRLCWLYAQKGVSYVSIYADQGELAGAIQSHPHLNIITFSTIPPTIELEAISSHKLQNEEGRCPMCQIISKEINGPREILKTENFIAFCPWSPTHPYEFWIMPQKHVTSFAKITQKDINDLALIVRSTLGGLTKSIKDVSYSMAFHLSAERKNSKQIHWHIEVYPITKIVTGLERGYGISLNDISPEQAAEKLGYMCRAEFAKMVGLGK